MLYESISNVSLPKIGLGTSRIGGHIIPNRRREAYWLKVLHSALELGYTHIDTAEFYTFGYTEELIGRILIEKGIKRENIFITTKVWLNHLKYESLLHACENSLRRLATDYIDLYLIHIPNPLIPLKDTFRALNQLAEQGKVRNVGVSNFNLDRLKKSLDLSRTPILTNQIPLSLHERSYVKNGVFKYCQKNNILVTAYSPLRYVNKYANYNLQSIAKTHKVTPHQIALAWLTQQSHVITIPMSFNTKHQKDNLESANIVLSPEEMERLTYFS